MTDNLFAVTIPTVLPIRERLLGSLLTQLASICPGVPIAVSTHRFGDPPREHTVQALRRGAAFNCQWTIYLEDDAYLAPTFCQVAQHALAEAWSQGNRLVSFYSDNRRVLEAMDSGRNTCALPIRFFWSTVCVAVRTDDIESIAQFAPGWYAENEQHWHASDLLLAGFYANDAHDALLVVPSPVQHRDTGTTLGHAVRRRRYSRSFRRAYGPVPRLGAD
jgi:hypothetical protein